MMKMMIVRKEWERARVMGKSESNEIRDDLKRSR